MDDYRKELIIKCRKIEPVSLTWMVPELKHADRTLCIEKLEEKGKIEIPKHMIDIFYGGIIKAPVKVVKVDDKGKKHIWYFERECIRAHLRVKQTNPFTNEYLSIEMLEEAPELKEEIEQFKQKMIHQADLQQMIQEIREAEGPPPLVEADEESEYFKP